MTDPGRRRRLHRLCGPSGTVCGLAVDHRDSFRASLGRRELAAVSAGDIAAIKADLIAGLAPDATMILLDEEYGEGILLDGAVPAHVGLAMPLEAQGYEEVSSGRATLLLEGFGPDRAAWYGADACKLLLPYRPDHTESARRQDELVATMVAQCHTAGLPLILEPIVYRTAVNEARDFERAFPELVVETAGRLAALGPDLLKVQFPAATDGAGRDLDTAAAAEACGALTLACGPVPWVLLGGGSDAAILESQIAVAGRAGACGFIVGRTVWEPALVRDQVERRQIIASVCAPMLRRLREVAEATCRPVSGRSPVTTSASR